MSETAARQKHRSIPLRSQAQLSPLSSSVNDLIRTNSNNFNNSRSQLHASATTNSNMSLKRSEEQLSSSSSSSSISLDDLLGISCQSGSGINLCEIDSLEDVLKSRESTESPKSKTDPRTQQYIDWQQFIISGKVSMSTKNANVNLNYNEGQGYEQVQLSKPGSDVLLCRGSKSLEKHQAEAQLDHSSSSEDEDEFQLNVKSQSQNLDFGLQLRKTESQISNGTTQGLDSFEEPEYDYNTDPEDYDNFLIEREREKQRQFESQSVLPGLRPSQFNIEAQMSQSKQNQDHFNEHQPNQTFIGGDDESLNLASLISQTIDANDLKPESDDKISNLKMTSRETVENASTGGFWSTLSLINKSFSSSTSPSSNSKHPDVENLNSKNSMIKFNSQYQHEHEDDPDQYSSIKQDTVHKNDSAIKFSIFEPVTPEALTDEDNHIYGGNDCNDNDAFDDEKAEESTKYEHLEAESGLENPGSVSESSSTSSISKPFSNDNDFEDENESSVDNFESADFEAGNIFCSDSNSSMVHGDRDIQIQESPDQEAIDNVEEGIYFSNVPFEEVFSDAEDDRNSDAKLQSSLSPQTYLQKGEIKNAQEANYDENSCSSKLIFDNNFTANETDELGKITGLKEISSNERTEILENEIKNFDFESELEKYEHTELEPIIKPDEENDVHGNNTHCKDLIGNKSIVQDCAKTLQKVFQMHIGTPANENHTDNSCDCDSSESEQDSNLNKIRSSPRSSITKNYENGIETVPNSPSKPDFDNITTTTEKSGKVSKTNIKSTLSVITVTNSGEIQTEQQKKCFNPDTDNGNDNVSHSPVTPVIPVLPGIPSDLVDEEMLDFPDDTRWSRMEEYIDTLYVKMRTYSNDKSYRDSLNSTMDVNPQLTSICNPKSPLIRNRNQDYFKDNENDGEFVILRFPLHKDDAHSAMTLVKNCYLLNPKLQFVNTPSEIVYNLPIEICGDSRHHIGTLKMRCALALPVSFKLSSVHQLELSAEMGIILPHESVTIEIYSKLGPEKSYIDRLKIEGILVYAAPFIFNRNRSEDNVKYEDIEEFWNKFCGPRFRFAQTRFIRIVVLREDIEREIPRGFLNALWSTLRFINASKYTMRSKSYSAYPKEMLRQKKLSPLGQLILRRRQSLALDVEDHAEQLNDHRTSLTFGTFLLVGSIACYYFFVYKPEIHRVEFSRRIPSTWWQNMVLWMTKFWCQDSQSH